MNSISSFIFTKPPDEIERQRILNFSKVIFIVTIIVFFLLSLSKLLTPPAADASDYSLWALTFLNLFYYYILRKGKTQLAGSLYVITFWVVLSYLAWRFDGVKDSAVVAYLILIQIAIFMRGTWLALIISILSLVAIWILYFAEAKGLIIPNVDNSLNYSFDYSVILIMVITIIFLNSRSFMMYYNRIQKELEDRVKAEQKMKASEESFHTLFDENPLPTLLSELPSGIITNVNKRLSSAIGLEPHEMIGKDSSTLKLLNDIDDQKRLTQMLIEKGFVDNVEVCGKCLDGKNTYNLVFMRLVTIQQKPYCLTVIHDITDIKNAEKELSLARDRAEESDRLKSAFLANMSHEIRTPMNGILGFSELLKEPGLNGEDQQEFINIIQKSGVRMLNIINDLVDISRIESGQVEIDLTTINLNEQLEFIYDFFYPVAEQKGLRLNFINPVPEGNIFIQTDKSKLNTILTNLVKNAIKFTDKGSIEFGYDLEYGMRFFVKDTGIGIPKDRQNAVFDRFVQADLSDKRAFQGAGLGLSISKAYVEMLGGKIWIVSEENIGSEFYFTLPFIPGKEEIQYQGTNTGSIPEAIIKKLKVLIVEDDEVSEIVLTRTVKDIHKEILIARSGGEAVEICRNNSDLDLILMDIKIPGVDGYEATRQIRTFNSNVIIIAQTAFALLGDFEKAINAGCNDYVSKPVKKDYLIEKIISYFDKDLKSS